MSIRINNVAPDFYAQTTQGRLKFYEWTEQKWVVLFSHPKDFAPVSTTELYWLAKMHSEFEKRDTKVIALSLGSIELHEKWIQDIEKMGYAKVNYPIIADTNLDIAKLYGMISDTTVGDWHGRNISNNAAVRYLFILSPDKVIRLISAYPVNTGINVYEILRVLDSMQLTFYNKVGTPANWVQGGEVIIPATINDEEAKVMYPDGWKAVNSYLRKVPQPAILRKN